MPEHCRICEQVARFSPPVTVLDTPSASAVVAWKGRVRGSVIIVVHRHVTSFRDLNDVELSEVARLIHHVTPRMLQAYRADGLGVAWATGALAGQVDPHFLVEIIPRFANVPFAYGDTVAQEVWSDDERRSIALQLRSCEVIP